LVFKVAFKKHEYVTMRPLHTIQKHKLSEEDYRGARFKDWHIFVQGNNDLSGESEQVREVGPITPATKRGLSCSGK
jgi:hypothetical protein